LKEEIREGRGPPKREGETQEALGGGGKGRRRKVLTLGEERKYRSGKTLKKIAAGGAGKSNAA